MQKFKKLFKILSGPGLNFKKFFGWRARLRAGARPRALGVASRTALWECVAQDRIEACLSLIKARANVHTMRNLDLVDKHTTAVPCYPRDYLFLQV